MKRMKTKFIIFESTYRAIIFKLWKYILKVLYQVWCVATYILLLESHNPPIRGLWHDIPILQKKRLRPRERVDLPKRADPAKLHSYWLALASMWVLSKRYITSPPCPWSWHPAVKRLSQGVLSTGQTVLPSISWPAFSCASSQPCLEWLLSAEAD